jgi:hypothetical protein
MISPLRRYKPGLPFALPPLPARRDLASRLTSFGMETNKGDVMGKQARIGLLPGASAALLACRKRVTRSSRRQGR